MLCEDGDYRSSFLPPQYLYYPLETLLGVGDWLPGDRRKENDTSGIFQDPAPALPSRAAGKALREA